MRGRALGWGAALAGALVAAILLVTWKAASPLLFLLYPLLVLGALALLGLGTLWLLHRI
ncbi:MAG: hypothetical protein QN203_13145 [Armatimonadota bacterium]|nr:hypothetical protein [Armatimonadota bacterium]MDR7533611.1 hypothetical protein [Armatimonadota bacterium]